MQILTTILALIFGTIAAEFFNYAGYKVYKIQPTNEDHLKVVYSLKSNNDYDFWTEVLSVEKTVDVMVAPKDQKQLEEFLSVHEIKFSYLHYDLESVVIGEKIEQERLKNTRDINNRIEFNKYCRHAEINEYLHDLLLTYPELVTLEDIGTSLEGREMIVVRISTGESSAPKPIIQIDGGIHAREWISPATVTYIIDQLVTNSSNLYLIENVDWHILPVLNPDGYEYTHTNERMWRKTRSPGFFCWGTDGNRNYDFHWGTVGASTQECSDTYRGPSPASEKETLEYSTFVEKYASRIKLYLTFHSYGMYFLYPWGYTQDVPENGPQMDVVANAAADAIVEAGGPRYTVGGSSVVSYATSGETVDWAHGAAGIPFSYTVELPENSFVVPPGNILGIARETFEGVRVFGEFIRTEYGLKQSSV